MTTNPRSPAFKKQKEKNRINFENNNNVLKCFYFFFFC